VLRGRGRPHLQASVVQDGPSIRFEGEDLDRFAPPKQRRRGSGVIAVIRAVSFALTLYGLGMIFCLAIAVALPFVKRWDPRQRKLTDRLIQYWSKLLTWSFFKTRVYGRENLPPVDQAVVFVANHQSFMDILSSYHLSHPFKFVSKAEILKIPAVGFAMKATKTLTIKREDRRSQLQAFRECVDTLKNGTSIFVFPEGTRSKDGALIDFKKGPFAMAKRAKTPIVPITINGTGRIMPSKREYLMYCSRAGVQIVVHPMVSAEDVQKASDKELQDRVRGTIESAMPPSLRRGET